MNNLEANYISLNEAAKLTNYSQDYISLLCRQKKLKGTKIGRNWVTTKEWIESYINRTNGSGENVIPVKIENAEKQIGQLSQAGSIQSMESTEAEIGLPVCPAGRQPVSNVFRSGTKFCAKKENEISQHTPSPSSRNNGARQEGNRERVTCLPDGQANQLPQARAQESIPIFFRRIILAAFAVGIFSIGFVFFQDSSSLFVNQAFVEIEKITERASFNANLFLSSFDKNNIKKEHGTVAGVETFVGEENDIETENEKESGDGIVIIPLEGEIDSEENQRFIEKLSSSFSDKVEISPSGDGVSGVITSREDPDDNYLYLMVPVKEE